MWAGVAGVVLPALLMILALRAFVFGLYMVPTGSMLNTIREGDYVLGEKLSLAWQAPFPGDVVTFRSPEQQSMTLVKRIIATEGQTVDLRDGKVFVEDIELDEPYAIGKSLAPEDEQTVAYPHMVAVGCVWVMGDNREASRDSRWFGDVPIGSITSRVVAVYWPLEDAGPIVAGEEVKKLPHGIGRLLL